MVALPAQALLLGFLVALVSLRPFADDHRWKMPVRIALVFVAFMKVPPSLARKPLRTHARMRMHARAHARARTHIRARLHTFTHARCNRTRRAHDTAARGPRMPA